MPDGNSADKKWMEEENVAGKDLLIHFFDAYLVKRDLERALACLSDDIVSLGTGAHEVALNKGELKKLMEAEFAEIPGGFRYEIKDYCEHWYREDLYGVYCAVAVVMPEEAGAEALHALIHASPVQKLYVLGPTINSACITLLESFPVPCHYWIGSPLPNPAPPLAKQIQLASFHEKETAVFLHDQLGGDVL